MQYTNVKRAAVVSSLLLLTVLMDGCGSGLAGGGVEQTVPVAGVIKINGLVHGGQQAVSGSTIQLYAVGISGLKSASTGLIAGTVTTDVNGNFSITGDWDCTSNTVAYGANPELYIVAKGGNPGLTAGTNNGALAMMAALGPCSTVTASSFITINEVTTVASVYALAPFMADATHVGASGAGSVGLANAFTMANLLANMSSGTSPGASLPANVTAPVKEIYSLADVLAGCVNSSGIGGACSLLFAAATASGVAPSDTIGAALSVSTNPANNTATIFAQGIPTSPFQPVLTTAPGDWTMALKFTGGGLSSPAGIALDASGNAWVANAGGNSVTELSSSGGLLTGTAGYTGNNNIFGAQGIAVDQSGNVWVADTLLSSVVKLTVSSGVVQSSASYTGGGISGPTGLAIDSQNNVWVSNFAGGSITELNSSGTAVGTSPLTAGGTLKAPLGIAIDPTGNVWATDNTASDAAEFNQTQSLLSGAGYSDAATLSPEGIAFDASRRAWVADEGTSAISVFGSTGVSLLATPFVGGGLSMPSALAVDGSGTVWVANGQASGSLSKLVFGQSAPVSPPSGLAVLNVPSSLAIDASGNIWTANAGDNSVSEIIGVAAPSTMPLVISAGP